MTVYVLITTTGPHGPEVGLAAVRGGEAEITAHVATVLARRAAQWRVPAAPLDPWATIAVYSTLGTNCGRQWAEEVGT